MQAPGRILVSGIGDYRKELIEKYGGTYIDSSKVDLETYVASGPMEIWQMWFKSASAREDAGSVHTDQ